jgi:hypothetical protein
MWGDNEPGIQELILNCIRADIARRIAAHVKIVEHETTDIPEREDQTRYEAELHKELDHAYNRLNVHESKRRRENGQLRDPSVELEEPLDPEIRYDIVSDEGDFLDD